MIDVVETSCSIYVPPPFFFVSFRTILEIGTLAKFIGFFNSLYYSENMCTSGAARPIFIGDISKGMKIREK